MVHTLWLKQLLLALVKDEVDNDDRRRLEDHLEDLTATTTLTATIGSLRMERVNLLLGHILSGVRSAARIMTPRIALTGNAGFVTARST